jgi:CTP synthase (UTP-ammonia lyase)
MSNVMSAEPDLKRWQELATSVDSFTEDVKIAIVGKYTGLADSYLSVIKVRPCTATCVCVCLDSLCLCARLSVRHACC